MQPSFRKILVPIDFSSNTEVAVAKALDVIEKHQASLYLLHVKRGMFRSLNAVCRQNDSRRLVAWKEMLEEAVPWLSVQCGIAISGSVEQSIRNKAQSMNADLIVIGRGPRRSWLHFSDMVNTTRLAQQTGKPVLTVQPGSLHQPIKTVVVPLSEASPAGKVAALAQLCRRMRPVVHLVAFSGQSAYSLASTTSTLLQMFKWVQDVLRCPVEYTLLEGKQPAKQLMAYAGEANADVLLVYPEGESKIDWWNGYIQDVLPAHSKMQILTVQCSNKKRNELHYE